MLEGEKSEKPKDFGGICADPITIFLSVQVTMTVGLSLVSGLGASDLSRSKCWLFSPEGDFVLVSLLLWIFVAIFLATVYGQFVGQRRLSAREKATSALATKRHEINTRINGLFSVATLIRANLKDELLRLEMETLEVRIQTALAVILRLVVMAEGNQTRCRYACNIMRFVPSTDGKVPNGAPQPRFWDSDRNKLHGVLVLDSGFSQAQLCSEKAHIDVKLPKYFSLPIPHVPSEELAEARSRLVDENEASAAASINVLPGAPAAFALRVPVWHQNTEEIGGFLRNHTSFSAKVVGEMEVYFKSDLGKNIRSFVAFPIFGAGAQVVGVLNIHSDNPGLLKETAEAFKNTAEQLLETFARSLDPVVS